MLHTNMLEGINCGRGLKTSACFFFTLLLLRKCCPGEVRRTKLRLPDADWSGHIGPDWLKRKTKHEAAWSSWWLVDHKTKSLSRLPAWKMGLRVKLCPPRRGSLIASQVSHRLSRSLSAPRSLNLGFRPTIYTLTNTRALFIGCGGESGVGEGGLLRLRPSSCYQWLHHGDAEPRPLCAPQRRPGILRGFVSH